MDNVLKQRLVGALILVALGVVFWPIIFVEQGPKTTVERASIPPRPNVESTPIEPPDQMGLRKSPELQARNEVAAAEQRATDPAPPVLETADPAPEQATVEPVAVNSAAKSEVSTASKAASPPQTRSEAPVSPEIDQQGVPVAWILQVVTVSNAERAEQLRLRLLEMGEKAYVKKIRRQDKALYRVYIGPGFERARMDQLKPRIDAEFGVTSVVQRYLP